MDRDTLYLDNDEEITSVVDKLKGTEKNSVDLVIPKDALILHRASREIPPLKQF